MSENSKIEWTDHTFNPWWGCQKVSEGCKNCYAETLDNRYNHDNPHWGPGSDRKGMSLKYWLQPMRWNKEAQTAGIRKKVFCASMADVFEDHAQTGEWEQQLWDVIESTPWLIWQLLTKRPENIMKVVPHRWHTGFPENVWTGTSVENQDQTERIRHLSKVPASIRFLSCEPMLSPLHLQGHFEGMSYNWLNDSGIGPKIHWVIAGGESGPKARPMHPDWARSLRDQCQSAGVPLFFKQWGEWRQYDHDAGDNAKPLGMFQDNVFRIGNIVWDHKRESVHMAKVGKHAAGRLLDGKEHDEFPHPQQIKL